MDFSGVLQSVLAITTIIGVALAGLQRGVVQNLRETNKDLRDRGGDLEKERDEAEKERDEAKAENKKLAADLEALGRVVSNEVQIAAFGQVLDEHHTEARAYWKASTAQGQQIIEALKGLPGGTNG